MYILINIDFTCKWLNTSHNNGCISYPNIITSTYTFYQKTGLKSILILQGFQIYNYNGSLYYLKGIVNDVNKGTINSTFITSYGNNITYIGYSIITFSFQDSYLTMRYISYLGNWVLTNDSTSTTNTLNSVLPRYYTVANMMFFGINYFNMTLANDKSFTLHTTSFTNLATNYVFSSSINQISLAYFFTAYRDCPTGPTTYFVKDYVNPTNDDCVSSCPATLGIIDTPNLQCVGCHYSCASCSAVGDANCLTCQTGNRLAIPSSGYCSCNSGFLDAGVVACVSCDTYVPGCATCTLSTSCSTCKTGFNKVSPTNCTCTTGIIVNGACSTTWGCISTTTINSTLVCSACNYTQFFTLLTNYICGCILGTTLTNTATNVWTCKVVCGDHYVSPSYPCDDGNTINGDGCSSTCTVYPQYICVGILSAGSTCKLNISLPLTLVCSKRHVTDNIVTFYIATDACSQLSLFNLSTYFTTSIINNGIQAVYYPSSKLLIVSVNFQTDIERTNQTLLFSLSNSAYFWNNTVTLSFLAKGTNCELTVGDIQMNNIISLVTLGVVLFALATLIASFFFYRWIGLYLIQTFQAVYFLFSLITTFPLYFTPLINYLNYSDGFSTLIPYDYLRSYPLPDYLNGMHYYKYFLLNFNCMFALIFLTILLLIILKTIKRYYNSKQNKYLLRYITDKIYIIDKVYTYTFSNIYIIVVFISMYQIIFSFSIQMSSAAESQDRYILPDAVNVVAALVAFIILFSTISYIQYWYILLPRDATEYLEFMDMKFLSMQFHYPIIYLFYQIIFIGSLAIIYFESYSHILILCYQCIYLIVLLVLRPYRTIRKLTALIHNASIIYNQCIVITISAIFIWWNSLDSTQKINSTSQLTIIALIIISLLFLATVFTIVRLVVFNREISCDFCCCCKETMEILNYYSMKKIIKEEQKDQINNFQDSILMPIPVPKPDNSIEMEDIKPSVYRKLLEKPQKINYYVIEYNDKFKTFLDDKHVIWKSGYAQPSVLVPPSRSILLASQRKVATTRRSTIYYFLYLQNSKLKQRSTSKQPNPNYQNNTFE